VFNFNNVSLAERYGEGTEFMTKKAIMAYIDMFI
jgi:hypothetical protein